MNHLEPSLNSSPKLALRPARRASDYDWWDTPDDIDDDWNPPSEVDERGWVEAFGIGSNAPLLSRAKYARSPSAPEFAQECVQQH